MSQEDNTAGCLEEARIDKRKLTGEKELRKFFCLRCRNSKCGYAKWGGDAWEKRMATQVDRLLKNPSFADIENPKYSPIREIDFPDIAKEAIVLEIADQKGDWEIPTKEDALQLMTGKLGGVGDIVEKALSEMEEIHIIEVPSKSKPGTTYKVTLDASGKALSCTCKAGHYGRNCLHLKWAEEEWLSHEEREEIQEEELVEEPEPVPPPLSHTGPRTPPRDIIQDQLRNTSVPGEGVMLSPRGPQGGSQRATSPPEAPDPWAPRPKVMKPGSRITIGGKKNDREG